MENLTTQLHELAKAGSSHALTQDEKVCHSMYTTYYYFPILQFLYRRKLNSAFLVD